MLRWALAKILQTAAVLLIVSVASFSLLKLAPGDPVEHAGEQGIVESMRSN